MTRRNACPAHTPPPPPRRQARPRPLAPADGTRLYEALRAGEFVLVAPAGADAPADDRSVRTTGTGSRTLLVRPDGYIAWAGDKAVPAGTIGEGLTAATR